MPYYNRGDLIRFLSNNFYNLDWNYKLLKLSTILLGLQSIHSAHIIHRDLHSGNIFFDNIFIYVGDLGISKSATESTDSIENYGIIPYMAPEIFQGQKYTEASDIYSFGMIMWEFMTGRRPFWNRVHDAELIIEICDGLRPPIVTNAPEGYIELMKDCWNSDPNKRPEATDIYNRINRINGYNCEIKKSSEIGPVTTNNPGAIYKSRPLSDMIQSAMSTRSLRSQFITAEVGIKRKFEDNQTKTRFDEEKINKKIRLIENESNVYIKQEFELDIDINSIDDERYISQEIDFDI
ncbi:kinase-like domain-containing protein [Rhizophagus irregularis DAOM 181602=DAOM 197198]|uniref:Kinase-like domain-containing protein n=1 Tax=Rhizophagus irregularis (strain DAOM 181602 / DAOM 197198 / MUCL 43194) TaxID=747089 RepID=A0A2P4Q6T0_RHIID|nr:kinase-like domain-containing protein [Rhizophagus irregularis DAOM 181602=DAOM 197198]POG73324.1 kinase-like domain-containing protein [Rhizophagus irregularis DAOM 181602=DAOM 197198]|eukprot:XP_025180190.1 kinase-like domain-containing protein [Rhizophagus irregularis DAOM 181602=DAOM 197198]